MKGMISTIWHNFTGSFFVQQKMDKALISLVFAKITLEFVTL